MYTCCVRLESMAAWYSVQGKGGFIELALCLFATQSMLDQKEKLGEKRDFFFFWRTKRATPAPSSTAAGGESIGRTGLEKDVLELI